MGDFCHSAEDQKQLKRVIEFYHNTLKQSAEAQAYLKKRGIDNSDAVERFRLGYCDRSFGQTLPLRNRKAGEEIRSSLERIGILRDTGHEHFRGCEACDIAAMSQNGPFCPLMTFSSKISLPGPEACASGMC